MATYYLDYVNGSDSSNGSNWANAWKTITLGSTAARVAPGDTIRIAKSPDPTSLGVHGQWTCGPIPVYTNITSSTDATPIEVTSTSHGLVTGDVARIDGHTTNTYANGTWKVTRVDDNKFTLTGSYGNGAGAGASGTCTKYNSACVTLDTAVNLNIATCDLRSTWITADGAKVTVTQDTADWKHGNSSTKFACGATLGVEKAAYYTQSGGVLVDFSGYKQISFWIKTSVALAAGDFVLKLCSDTAGATPQTTINIPAISTVNRWYPITVNTASALGNAVKSVGLYQAVDKGAINIWLDNIVACKDATAADSLSLTSLISLNSAAQGGTAGWLGIQSIDSTLIVLDMNTDSTPIAIKGWAGTTTHDTTYKRETIKTAQAATQTATVQTIQEAGTVGSMVTYEGGYNITNSNLDGETFFDGQLGYGTGLTVGVSYIVINRLNFCRYFIGLNVGGAGSYQVNVPNLQSSNNNDYGVVINYVSNVNFTTVSSVCNNRINGINFKSGGTATSYYASDIYFKLVSNCNGNGIPGAWTGGVNFWNNHSCIFDEITLCACNDAMGLFIDSCCHTIIRKVHTLGNSRSSNTSSTALTHGKGGHSLIINGTFDEGVGGDGTFFANYGGDDRVYVQNLKKFYGEFVIGDFQTATKYGAIGAWRLYLFNAIRNSSYMVRYSLARFEVHNGVAVSADVMVSKSHATNIYAQLVIPGLQVAGMDTDAIDVKADDTNWEKLTVTGNPTADGIVELEMQVWYVGGAAYVYVDSEMIITS
jgi:hypothetical protein